MRKDSAMVYAAVVFGGMHSVDDYIRAGGQRRTGGIS